MVSNADTRLDVDRFDYLERDIRNVGIDGAHSFDHRRLARFTSVVQGQLSYHRKEVFNIYDLFLTRFQLFRSVYNHRAALTLDATFADALITADFR